MTIKNKYSAIATNYKQETYKSAQISDEKK